MPSTLNLGKETNEWGKARFMVFTIKLGHVPPPEGSFNREIDKATIGVSLKANNTDNFSIDGAGLVF
jgi:hypothetical protein